VRALVQAVCRASWIEVVEATCAEELLVRHGRVVGVLARQGEYWQTYAARAVILATGGLGQVFRYTTNPPEATADGLAMAARAGARLSDIEFVQFHPTALATGNDPMPLLTEALRGEGAILVNRSGHRFMLDVHPEGELAPRDVVARAIWHQLQAGEKVFLDGRTSIGEHFPTRFPTVFERCQEYGLDPRHELLPVAPAAHYHMGGIAVDLHGRTSLPGLWACGEVAATGIHGANRLASNSLLEALVFGRRVGEDLSQRLLHRTDAAVLPELALHTLAAQRSPAAGVAWGCKLPNLPCSTDSAAGNGAKPGGQLLKQHIRDLMWEKVGLVRTEAGLQEALRELQTLEAHCRPRHGETRNLLTVGRLIAAAALLRRESRGAHFRLDFPACDPHWQRHSVWTAVELDAASFSLAALEPASPIGDL
jgi:L-aspartate oxidase